MKRVRDWGWGMEDVCNTINNKSVFEKNIPMIYIFQKHRLMCSEIRRIFILYIKRLIYKLTEWQNDRLL